MARPEIHIGALVAYSVAGDLDRLTAFTERMLLDGVAVLGPRTGADWTYDLEEPIRLESDDPRRPSDFLDDAALRMVEGPYDMLVVVTDVVLTSRRRRVVPGLASPVARIAVVSTRQLRVTPRGRPPRPIDSEPVRWNAATLYLHLVGHLLGLRHGRGVMAPFAFVDDRAGAPTFDAPDAALRHRVRRIPQRTRHGGGPLGDVAFYLAGAARNAGEILRTVYHSRAPLLPLSLPSLATAAVVPTFILIFTAEIWDVGLTMPENTVWFFAAASILAATLYFTFALDLFFPRKERRVLSEHLAVVNSAIFLTILFAMLGLLGLVGLLMLAIELFIFPAGLMATWPTLEIPPVTLFDRVRIAVFIATIGALTGALAGGLASRTVVRHLALFLDDP